MFSCEFAKRGPVNFSANMEQNPGVKYEDKKNRNRKKSWDKYYVSVRKIGI